MNPVAEVPKGCLEVPGFIVVVMPGEVWLDQDGLPTLLWESRGVWSTPEEASAVADRFRAHLS